MTEPHLVNPQRRSSDRLAPLRLVGTILGAVLAVATLIWGAARISSSVDNMNLAVNQLQSTTESLKTTITGILVQQARNQAEIEAIKARLDPRQQ
jgi:hypothetical protein